MAKNHLWGAPQKSWYMLGEHQDLPKQIKSFHLFTLQALEGEAGDREAAGGDGSH